MAEEKGDYTNSKIHVFTLSVGHEVVRLPVAHCKLNPIEMAWSQVKGYVKDNNKKYGVNNNYVNVHFYNSFLYRFTLSEVKELVYKGFEKVTPDRWQSLITHVQVKVKSINIMKVYEYSCVKTEDHYWEVDGLNEDLLEEFIINISDSESDDDQANQGVNEGFSDGDSTTFGSRSESSGSSDEVENKY